VQAFVGAGWQGSQQGLLHNLLALLAGGRTVDRGLARIVALIDGDRLAELMIRFGVG
jgi:restriction endonuclease Mrr